MLRSLVVGLTLLHLGPGIAFALLAFGCGGPEPLLPAVCGPRPLSSFALLTLASWAILVAGFAAWHFVERARRATLANPRPRLAALAALLALGASLAASGVWLTGSSHAWLAVPAALALGWLRLANPEACVTGTAADGPQRD